MKLTVTDSLGRVGERRGDGRHRRYGPARGLHVDSGPSASGRAGEFNGSQSVAPAGSTISVFLYDFGDGTMNVPGDVMGNASHTYNVQATFKPKLKVIDPMNRVSESPCPDVTVGVPPLCTGPYSFATTANPNMMSCVMGLVNGSFAGGQMQVAQMADGTMTASEMFRACPSSTRAPGRARRSC